MKLKIKNFTKILLLSFLITLAVSFSPRILAENSSLDIYQIEAKQIINQGTNLTLNHKNYPAAWIQWQVGNQIHTGISDTAAMSILGMELLSTSKPELQPIQWFSLRTTLKTKSFGVYRYLDVTNFRPIVNSKITVNNDVLNINSLTAYIRRITTVTLPREKQIVVNLDRPTFWQISQTSKEAIIKIEGDPNPKLLEIFPAPPPVEEEEIDLEANNPTPIPDDNQSLVTPPPPPLLIVEKGESQTILKINLPENNRVRVTSLANRLFIDVKQDNFVTKDILWKKDLRWQQQYVKLPVIRNDRKQEDFFPVTSLEFPLDSPNFYLQPITSNNNNMVGITPLITTARSQQVIAAINGGFFNRNNQLPLGAIRRDNLWLSGPILDRGAIAWNNQGRFKLGRLRLKETLTTETGTSLPIILLNSGYVKVGIARYTPEWGPSYQTLIDNEIIVVVKNNRITEHLFATVAGLESFPIPQDGYLLVLRSYNSALSQLAINQKIRLRSTTIPADFADYPQIVAAGPLLLSKGQIVLNPQVEKFNSNFIGQSASRSAIAVNNQGKIMIVAVHNRVGGKGPTLTEMSEIMQYLGAIDALNLDGGSSTSLYLGGQLIDRSSITAARVHNGIGIFFKS